MAHLLNFIYYIEMSPAMGFLIPVFSGVLAFVITLLLTPRIMKRMERNGFVGTDVNKKDKRKVPEMGGIAFVLGFIVAIGVSVGVEKILSSTNASAVLAIMGVLFIAAFIGIIDDLTSIPQRTKAFLVAFAAIPLMLVHVGTSTIHFPFGYNITFPFYFYWLILVPFAVTGAANALNMSAGYNGLETGQVLVISFFLIVLAAIEGSGESSFLIFFTLLGATAALYYFNRYPARTFVGDVGTLGMGAVIGAGVVIAKLEFYGMILIAPAFFELLSTLYHGRKGINRREACMNPTILDDGRLKTPEGAEWYTLPYHILSKKPLMEKELVNKVLMAYVLAGFLSVALALL